MCPIENEWIVIQYWYNIIIIIIIVVKCDDSSFGR
jgi:hypothetical protein